MTNLTVFATPKFFKKKLPLECDMELIAQVGYMDATRGTILMFVREVDDSDNPSRIRMRLTPEQAKRLAGDLTQYSEEATRLSK